MNTFFDGTIEFFLTFTTTKVDRVLEDTESLVALYDSYLFTVNVILVLVGVIIAVITVLIALVSLYVVIFGKKAIKKWIANVTRDSLETERIRRMLLPSTEGHSAEKNENKVGKIQGENDVKKD